ncbi:DNA repair protein RecN [bacterium]|nr:DNA repair protein RecN [bacterium]
MIKSIYVKNFILIDELKLDLNNGFTVITGETGAGKSILLHSIDVALGAKSSKELIKSGENSSNIEIIFKINNLSLALQNLLSENGIELFEDEIIVSKEISLTSSRSRVNGVLVTQDFIKNLRELLIDIHTQHQSYTYLQPKYHIELLDRYGNSEHKSLVNNFSLNYEKYIEAKKQLEKIVSANSNTQSQIDFLKFQIEEIEKVQIEDNNEDKRLDEELSILTNAGDLKQMSNAVYYAISEDENAILSHLNLIKSQLNKYSDIDREISEASESVENALEILHEVSSNMRNYSDRMEVDEQKIFEVQQRIEVLEKLKRKYGHTLENVVENYKKFKEELSLIENGVENQAELELEVKKYYEVSVDLAKRISENRKQLAKELSEVLTKELEKLELPKVRFEVRCEDCELYKNGFDNVEFLISTNVSESVKPLIKVASGGEISRVMLALKTVFAVEDNVETVIFDEIDTGVSGTASQAVADEIKILSKTHQVLCITHQPIIAAKADNHLFVVKKQTDTTLVNVYSLSETEKIHAIAMLASGNDDEKSLEFAKGLMGE